MMHYFQAGTTILYCLLKTPTSQQTPLFTSPVVMEAIRGCLNVLAEFSQNWAAAKEFWQIYDILVETTLSNSGRGILSMQESKRASLYCLLAKLRSVGANRWAMEMIEDMMDDKLNP